MMRRLISAGSLALMLIALGGCSGGSISTVGQATPSASVAPTWTPAPSPTATTIPAGAAATPTNVPTGWQVYAAAHFSIAYPGDWIVQIQPLYEGGTAYDFQKPDSSLVATVEETDNLDAQSVVAACSPPYQNVMLAGLPMHYSSYEGGHQEDWVFVTSNANAYLLHITNGTTDTSIELIDKSILDTFRPDDTTSGCQ